MARRFKVLLKIVIQLLNSNCQTWLIRTLRGGDVKLFADSRLFILVVSLEIFTKEWVFWKFVHFEFYEVRFLFAFLYFFTLEVKKTEKNPS